MDDLLKKYKCCAYFRKSSEGDERQALSIPAQKQEVDRVIERYQVTNTAIYEESQSAKKPGRIVFNELVADIYAGKVDVVFCWSVDRLSRNPVDSGQIIHLIDLQKLKAIVTPTKVYTKDPTDLYFLNQLLGSAKFENDTRSVNSARGMKFKSEKGWYPFPAPTGYLNTPELRKGFKIIKKDEERYPLIKQAWQMLLSRRYNVKEILVWLNTTQGFLTHPTPNRSAKPLSRSGLYSVFKNTFYAGYFTFQGVEYVGLHEAMITREEYEMAQKILGRKHNSRRKTHTFAYTGVIKCAICGYGVTASQKIKQVKNGSVKTHSYYHCSGKSTEMKCPKPTIRLDQLELQVADILSKIEIHPEFKDWAIKYLRETHDTESKGRRVIYRQAQSQVDQKQAELDELLRLKIRGILEDSEYLEMKNTITRERDKARALVADGEKQADDWIVKVEKSLDFATDVRSRFEIGTLEQKRTIFQSLGSNFLLSDGKIALELDKPFFIIRDVRTNPQKYLKRIEPEERTIVTGQMAQFAKTNPDWLPIVTEVRRHIIKQTEYHDWPAALCT